MLNLPTHELLDAWKYPINFDCGVSYPTEKKLSGALDRLWGYVLILISTDFVGCCNIEYTFMNYFVHPLRQVFIFTEENNNKFCSYYQRGHFGTLLSVEGIWVFARSVTYKKGWYGKRVGICHPQHSGNTVKM